MKKSTLWLLGIGLALPVMVWAAFPLQRMLSPDYWDVYPALFIALSAGLFVALGRIIRTRLEDKSPAWVLAGCAWIAAMVLLYFLSSANRPAEIRVYFAKRRPVLEEGRLLLARGDTASADSLFRTIHMKREQNVRDSGSWHLQLYRFAGYGYRLYYATDPQLAADNTRRSAERLLGPLPLRKWIALGQGWYYASYAD